MTRLQVLQQGRRYLRRLNDSAKTNNLRSGAMPSAGSSVAERNASPQSEQYHNHQQIQTTDYYARSSFDEALNQVLESQRVTTCRPNFTYETVVKSIVKS